MIQFQRDKIYISILGTNEYRFKLLARTEKTVTIDSTEFMKPLTLKLDVIDNCESTKSFKINNNLPSLCLWASDYID